ncbi:superoxide dismutase [Cu-Zn] SodC1 [Pseudomonas sp. Choline-3u-10]|jgi:Cu-Zn family superoxide dismutase|uniref:superoxide dismutase family protein n=1 Tax=Pseudomonadaceae TaxID=135621 RepID=UPI000617B272|nr:MULTISPECIES: superoxide dismutase family protein [Pseudomonadaceae]MAL35458.1 superoxide dismutase [Cu-Zn] SodC1 [Pseudomonas sp.]MBU0951087.1 superoxide dismutase family protein [Gammaproteobacteria bacterium]KJJ63894.1 superoxide dismutase [Pseudomonas sp. 10B238]MBK3794977.1 superoxide dismutase [Cu-Zn] SodC1 [Stutzerimonas stutzeri]MBK3878670.1 superoxide dismutase [Cu-Zn] SodC1 [Stutzerimonas stutzeri]|tara:strand:+ start:2851 stop:3372 length:522 start_codon:yes stop_codon:yes gene_type:complete
MKQWLIAAMASCAAVGVQAETLSVEMNKVNDQGVASSVGTVKIETTDQGLVLRPNLSGMNAGAHGFHVHANGSCQPAEKDGKQAAAVAAGGHWDPKNAGKHGEPWGEGHMGDLPVLIVDAEGKANQPVLAPRLKSLGDLKGHALMVHEGGDNYSDEPKPLGGGGARVACGVIE